MATKKGKTRGAASADRVNLSVVEKPARGIVNRTSLIRHLDRLDARASTVTASDLAFEKLEAMVDAPKDVNVSIEPKDGDYVVYHPTPGFTFYDSPLGQLSILACINNQGTAQIDLDKVTIEYKKGNQTVTKSVSLPSDQLKIDPHYTWCWQNGRPYHESGDVVFLEAPFPSDATFKFYFKGYTTPIVVKKKLKAYTQALDLPFETKDLRTNEYWSGYSMHGGGDQVYAYDLGVSGHDNGWSDVLPGKDGTKNEHFRIWGKPVYAMADGYVLEALNECPNNAGPMPSGLTKEQFDAKMTEQKDKYWGAYEKQGGGAGNHLCVRHGNLVALYAHLQKASIGQALLTKNAPVSKGALLGKAGNSGNSSGPHLHVQVKTYKDDATTGGEFFRPLIFKNGFVIGTAKYASPKSNVAWTGLKKDGIPGVQGKACFIWPGDAHLYCAYPTNWGEVSKHGVAEANFQTEFDQIWTCGYYPIWMDGYDVGGKAYFNLIFRPSAGVQWAARHNMDGTAYQAEYTKWDKEGFRLLTVDSYRRGNKINYTAVWVKDGGAQPLAYHGATLASHEQSFKANANKGLVPVNVSCVAAGGTTYVTAIWEKKNVGGFYSRPAMTLQQYKDYFKDYSDTQGFKLVYLSGYTVGSTPMLSGIWYRNAANYGAWWAKHHLSSAAYQAEYKAQTGNGFLTRCVTGYADGATHRFEGIWSK
jgi:hypothetical protein